MCTARGGMAMRVFGQCHMGHSDMQNLNDQQANLIGGGWQVLRPRPSPLLVYGNIISYM